MNYRQYNNIIEENIQSEMCEQNKKDDVLCDCEKWRLRPGHQSPITPRVQNVPILRGALKNTKNRETRRK